MTPPAIAVTSASHSRRVPMSGRGEHIPNDYSSTMAQCIYCRRTTSGAQFSRPDHVIPKAFGRFKNNLTIFSVCEECNQWFGDNLENSFGRNSGEAILRLLFGVKPSNEANQVGGDRITLVLDEESELKGATVLLTAEPDGRLSVATPAQIGFRFPGTKKIRWFHEHDLTSESAAPYGGCEIWTVGTDVSDYERIDQKLEALGLSEMEIIDVRRDGTGKLKETPITINYQLDSEIFRVIARIGFNYLAHQAGWDFALLSDFDDFRRFVRYGEGEQGNFIKLTSRSLLLDEKLYGGKQTIGHLIALDWHPRKRVPTGSVKLFNDLHYQLVFAGKMHVIWREIRSGHHFDISDLTIDRLTTVRWPPF